MAGVGIQGSVSRSNQVLESFREDERYIYPEVFELARAAYTGGNEELRESNVRMLRRSRAGIPYL